MIFTGTKERFSISLNGLVLINNSVDEPAFFAGIGEGESNLYRGNFKVLDRKISRFPLEVIGVDAQPKEVVITLKRASANAAEVVITLDKINKKLHVRLVTKELNRFWLRLCSEVGEQLWGGGEQFSHFGLAGRRFPMWVQEPGVGRDMTTRVSMIAELEGQAGAHEAATYYPQPTFISSRHYAVHIDSSAYSVLDFSARVFHELEVWDTDFAFELYGGNSLESLVKQLAKRFGHSGHIPEWVYGGAILGLKRGLTKNLEILDQALAAGVLVSGLWCEDWAGLRQTAFGSRLFWNWQWNETRYPDLPNKIKELRAKGIRFLTYNNPNLCSDGALFKEAAEQDVLTKNPDGSICTIDFGEFDCGFVDFSTEKGRQWYKDRIIKKNLLDLGISGWMADFGEYQPTDMCVASGEEGWKTHNQWPALWAQVNAEAIAECGLTDDILFFMRAGYSGSQKHCKLLWAGDQLVDFSRHDGLETAVCAALSSGMLGNAVSHSDTGGFTTLYGNVRTEEVFMRWAEMSAFSPVMRTHESNRPDESFQFYQSERAMQHFAKMTRLYKALNPYLRVLSAEAAESGMPIQRPLALHYEADQNTWAIHDQYLYGADLLVAPVHKAAVKNWRVYLPAGETWIHLWSHVSFSGGQHVEVAAPFEQPPVFYKKGSTWETLFLKLCDV